MIIEFHDWRNKNLIYENKLLVCGKKPLHYSEDINKLDQSWTKVVSIRGEVENLKNVYFENWATSYTNFVHLSYAQFRNYISTHVTHEARQT